MENYNVKKGILFVLSGIFVFSLMSAFIKSIEGTYAPIQVAFMRFLWSMLPCFIFYITEKNRPSLISDKKTMQMHIARSLATTVSITALCFAIKTLPLSEVTVLNFSVVFFIAALSIFLLKQSVPLIRWIAIIVGFLGVIIVSNPQGGMSNTDGVFYALLYAFLDAFVIISGNILSKRHSPGATMFLLTFFAAIISGFFTFFYWVTPSTFDIVIFSLIGLCGGIGFVFQTLAYNYAPASIAAPMSYSGLIWGGVLGYVFWGEVPTQNLFFGSLIIVASGLFIIYHESKSKTQTKEL